MNVTDRIRPTPYAASSLRAAKRALVILLLLAAVCASVWYSRVTLLREAAELWIVSDPVGPADAAVVFGGGLDARPFAAAEYYKNGLVKKVLISNVRPSRAELLLEKDSHTAWNRNVLLKLGVPETAIELFGSRLSNAYQEAVALREWAINTEARRVIVPVEAFSSRRVRWVIERERAGTGIKIQVPALDNPDYSPSDWWKDEKGIVDFQNEVLKYAYYRIKY
jgi:uncharacterized SAM-binding protein YcdF (DUF218 family)